MTPNPSEMLGSARMSSVLAETVRDARPVIIDTAPVLVVSDAFPLLGQVSGIVALARLEQTPRDAVRRMVEVALTAGGRSSGWWRQGQLREDYTGGYGYGYGYGYGEPVPTPEHTTPPAPGATNGSGPGQPVAAGPSGWVRRVFRSG